MDDKELYRERVEEILDLITLDQVKELMRELGAEVVDETSSEYLIFNTVCHRGASNKLYFYTETKGFMCYTHCGFMSFINFFMSSWGCDYWKTVDIMREKLGISRGKFVTGYNSSFKEEVIETRNLMDKLNRKSRDNVKLEVINNVVLEMFENKYKLEWLMDNISSEAMKTFNIKYYYEEDKVIIPHYNIGRELIGIRTRNFKQEDIDRRMKYSPLFLCGKMYNHALGFNLYGIDKNLENIKRKKVIVLVEGEKGVLQAETYYGRDDNVTVATCGSNLSEFQRDLILKLGVERIYIAFDRQWKSKDTEDYKLWVKKVEKIVLMFSMFLDVYIVWDNDDLLDYKDSLYDKGFQVAETLFKNSFREIMSFEEVKCLQYEDKVEEKCVIKENQSLKKEKYWL